MEREEEMAEKQKNGKIEAALDIAKEIIFFLLFTAAMLAYWMLMLLIISFVTSSFLHFSIQGIIIGAVLGTVVLDVYYILRKVKKRQGK